MSRTSKVVGAIVILLIGGYSLQTCQRSADADYEEHQRMCEIVGPEGPGC